MDNRYVSSNINELPPQMLRLTEKTEDWKKACLDRLENIGRSQFYQNLRLAENYQMIKGKFIFKHYFEQEGYADMVNQLTQEFDLPSYLRHYDIISQVVNTLSGEWQARPDNFRVKSFGEKHDNDFLRAKTEMLLNYIQYNINNEINQKLLQQGIDPNRTEFNSEEEQQQYVQLVEERRQVLTPEEIQEYMTNKWMQVAEIWGQHQLEYDKERFKLDEKEKQEFEDMCVADRCFRHFYIKGDSYEQETWNPLNTFFHKSDEVYEVENGDYVGRTLWLSTSDIIDRYGWKMSSDQLDQLKGDIAANQWGKTDAYGIVHGSVVPFQGYGEFKTYVDTIGSNPYTSMGIPTVGKEFFDLLRNENQYYVNTKGLLCVTEAYWKSQKRIGKIVYINEEGILTKEIVDENFIVPKIFKEKNSAFYDEDEPNTITWTWVNEVWKGTKINPRMNSNSTEAIYLDVKPVEFQFKGDLNPFKAKLPVCGQIFSVRNSNSMSLVDLMKPHQIGYNIAMNQLYQIMEREIGRFIVMDVNMFPALKDWGGEKSWEKFMLVAKSLGMAPVDTSPQNTNASAAAFGGQYPKDMDLDEGARMMSRMRIAEFFEGMALKQVGFNDYRVGDFTSESTKAGIEQGKNTSYAATQTYFTNFSNYIRRCHTMNLDIAQYVQSRKENITVSYIKSDLSRAFIKIAGTELMGNDMGVFVSDSQEMIRQLETMRQLAFNNNQNTTTEDLADIVMMNSPQELKSKLRQNRLKQEAREDRQIELQQQQLEQQSQIEQAKREADDMRQQRELESKERIAYIQASGKQQAEDSNTDVLSDLMEYDRLESDKSASSSKTQLDREKHLLDKERFIAEKEMAVKKMELEQRKIEAGLEIEDKKIQLMKILKDKAAKEKPKK